MVDVNEEIGSIGVEKEENGYTCQPQIRQTVFAAGWLTLFLSQIHVRTKCTQLSPIYPRC